MGGALLARADLLRALLAVPEADRASVASLMGYIAPAASPDQPPPIDLTETVPAPVVPVPRIPPRPLAPVAFWQPDRFTPRPPLTGTPPGGSLVWRGRPGVPPVFHVLASWGALEPRLRRLLSAWAPATEIDADRAAEALGRGRPLAPLPHRQHRDWPRQIDIVVDRSDRLIPFWRDQDLVVAAMRARIPVATIRVARIDEALEVPWLQGDGPWTPASAGGVVLVLGDLGCLDKAPRRLQWQWIRFAAMVRAAACRPAALLTAPLARCPQVLRRTWQVEPWETPGPDLLQDELSRQQRVERLLGLLAGAVRIEPGLLRGVRRALPPAAADLGTEADLWQDRALRSPHPAAATPDKAICDAIGPAAADPELWKEVVGRRRAWREQCRDEVWFIEVLGLPPAARAMLPDGDFDDARTFFHTLHAGPEAVADKTVVETFLDEAARRAAAAAWDVPEFVAAVGERAVRTDPARLPDHLDPYHLPPLSGPGRMLTVHQLGGGTLAVLADDPVPTAGSPLGLLQCGYALAQIVPDESPPWAEDQGEDENGAWASFSVAGANGTPVTQRLRWCPPGRFLMGSPEDEEGHWNGEGPQHEVVLADGFWLFETACTEVLWEAVTGKAPDPRRGAAFPVTNVSWDDAQDFISRLNALKPGLDLGLPSEAGWEYACRAGTDTPYSFGTTISKNQVCYESGAPVPVGSLPPNQWGLREMHGNVWEWCVDHWHDNYKNAPMDGSAWVDDGGAANRVVRGGSWFNFARLVRAACRDRNEPGNRHDNLGFRCARVQVSDQRSGAEQVAAPVGPCGRPGAERGRPQGPTGAATLLRVGASVPAPLPRATSLLIRTDREELRLRRVSRADKELAWASGLGRDRYGLFAGFTLPGTEVTQRLRWCPPGRFLRGSLKDEEGRWSAEGPQHEVTLAEGYWLFDTPCTQALWEAVMGENPSRFRSPTRPVEQVSYEDVQTFLQKLNARVGGLELCLPSEAQWEYACRAGTTTATWAGDLTILGENNAPELDKIAWYGGNSGVGFELENGEDSSGWPGKQHEHTRAGTRPVGQKAANPWGLHDMLGNVWEWCADHWHESYSGAPTDGSAWIDRAGAAYRVVRGGSWYYDARFVRAAYRFWFVPGFRYDYLGFRCARVQGESAVSEVERSEGPGRSKRSERSEQAATTGPKRRGGTRSKK